MWNEEKLNELLTTPSDKLVSDIAKKHTECFNKFYGLLGG